MRFRRQKRNRAAATVERALVRIMAVFWLTRRFARHHLRLAR